GPFSIYLRRIYCGKILPRQVVSAYLCATWVLRRKELHLSEPTTEPVEIVRVRVLPDGRLDRENAARYLGHKPKTLAMWQLQGRGPRSVLVGGRRFYFKAELDNFIRGSTK